MLCQHARMWLVPRHSSGTMRRTAVPQSVQTALIRWYKGDGNEADHRASRTLVVKARHSNQWIACGCRGEDCTPPLLSPSYLSEAETYYLRRLTSEKQSRPEHRTNCPFYREQAPQRIREKSSAVPGEISHAKNFFSAHKRAPEKLAQGPTNLEVDDRTRGVAIPRLARLLWMLLEKAGTTIVPYLPESGSGPSGLYEEFRRVERITHILEVAPGVPLSRHFYTHVDAIGSMAARKKLEESEASWPSAHAPQAFALLYANDISGCDAYLAEDYVLSVANRIQHNGNKAEIGGPYLVLVLIAEHSPAVGHIALRAFAQPIVSAPYFIPVNNAAEREVARQLLRLRFYFRRRGIAVGFERHLFDVPTSVGMARPDFSLHLTDTRTGEVVQTAIYVSCSGNEPDPRLAEAETLKTLGEVLVLDGTRPDLIDLQSYIVERLK